MTAYEKVAGSDVLLVKGYWGLDSVSVIIKMVTKLFISYLATCCQKIGYPNYKNILYITILLLLTSSLLPIRPGPEPSSECNPEPNPDSEKMSE